MELNQALKILMELAEANMVEDPEMAEERAMQEEALATAQMHMDELENPSPIQAVLITGGGVIHEFISNVPTVVTVLDDDLEGAESGDVRLFPSEGDAEYLVGSPSTDCDPVRVATLVAEATA